MLNNGKIRLMTKIALYEEKETKKALRTNQYYKKDYISFHVLKIILAVTVSFGICFLMWGVYRAEAILTEASIAQIFHMAGFLLLLYGIIVVGYLILAFVVYQERYQKIQKGLRRYHAYLKKLDQFYDQSSPEKMGKEEMPE